MNITPLFPSFLASEEPDVDNNIITKYCNSLIGDSVTIDPSVDELFELTEWMVSRANRLRELQGLHDYLKVNLNECWVNTLSNQLSYINHPHAHADNWISFVYYVSANKDSGNIIFMSPHQNIELTIPRSYVSNGNLHNSPRWTVTPFNGLAIAFPSWLTHYVEHNRSSEPRISIAYNFTLS
tara:strand:- start:4469 stop:5014 length:546 start_codon:yes stop_codon:yes gene_type:complete